MPQYLRDEAVENVTIDRDALAQLVQTFMARLTLLPEYTNQQQGEPLDVVTLFTIRFDQKGYQVTQLDDLMHYFDEASSVERLVLALQTGEYLRTNAIRGASLDLRLDANEQSSAFLTASSDDEDWMSGSFMAVKDVLTRHKNKYALIRNVWVDTLIQLVGLALGFVISLVVAARVAPYLTIENAFLICFVIALLVFGNLWGPSNAMLRNGVRSAFPRVKFYRSNKDKWEWLKQGIVIAILGAVALWALAWVAGYVARLLQPFLVGAE